MTGLIGRVLKLLEGGLEPMAGRGPTRTWALRRLPQHENEV